MHAIGLGLHVHNTQPAGTTGDAFRRACERAYWPLLELLDEFQSLRVSMHWSGQLLEWMDLHAPAWLDRLIALAASGRIEIIGGLHGGGVLPALPERDAVGQVQVMQRWWREHGDIRPRGAWLPYCAWDPSAARVFARLGIHFTLLEDAQFSPPVSGDGYYVTEREGSAIALFAIDGRISRMFPSAPPKKIIEALAGLSRQGRRSVVVSVAGEAFGAAIDASSTRNFNARTGWVRRMFTELVEASPWLKMVSMATMIDKMRPTGSAWPQPSASLPVAAAGLGAIGSDFGRLVLDTRRGEDPALVRAAPYLRAPNWDQVLASFPEVNRLHKRMLRASTQVYKLKSTLRGGAPGQDGGALAAALDEATAALYRGQAGAAYVFGTEIGAADGAIRAEAYRNLARAEFAIATVSADVNRLAVEQIDYDCDGKREVVVRTPHMCAFISPAVGGSLVELDAWRLPGNLVNVRGRLPEAHHQYVQRGEDLPALVLPPDPAHLEITDEDADDPHTADELERPPRLSEPDLPGRLFYDRHPRGVFIDHFLGPEATLENLVKGRFPETGDFAGTDYQLVKVEDDTSICTITMARDGNVTEGAALRLVRVVKRIGFGKDLPVVDARYEVRNRYHEPIRTRFAVQIDLNLDSARHEETFLETAGGRRIALDAPGEVEETTEISLCDVRRGWKVSLSLATAARVWHYPIENVGIGPRGVQTYFNGTAIFLWWPLELWGMERRRIDFAMSLEA